MPDLLIRDVPEATMLRLDGQAEAAGQSRLQWLRARLEELAEQAVTPVVRERYRLVCSGHGTAAATLRRYGDGEPSGGGMADCSEAQAAAVRRARLLVEQNGPGDRERAIAALAAVFDEVLEGSG